jgi:hypothetical protein
VVLGRTRFKIVGFIEDVMNTGGDPDLYTTLTDTQTPRLQLANQAAWVQQTRGEIGDSTKGHLLLDGESVYENRGLGSSWICCAN